MRWEKVPRGAALAAKWSPAPETMWSWGQRQSQVFRKKLLNLLFLGAGWEGPGTTRGCARLCASASSLPSRTSRKLSPAAAVTKDHGGSASNTETYFLPVWTPKSRCWQSVPSEALREGPLCVVCRWLPSLWVCSRRLPSVPVSVLPLRILSCWLQTHPSVLI